MKPWSRTRVHRTALWLPRGVGPGWHLERTRAQEGHHRCRDRLRADQIVRRLWPGLVGVPLRAQGILASRHDGR